MHIILDFENRCTRNRYPDDIVKKVVMKSIVYASTYKFL